MRAEIPADGAPQRFSEVIGHTLVLRALTHAFERGRGHHAYLFAGPSGIGKETVARILGRSLLCERGAVGDPCGRCGSCRRVGAGSHADWVEVQTPGEYLTIEAVRSLNHVFLYRPFEGGRRVALIVDAERLTREAGNALLKTLEEPPQGSTFLLHTANPARLLPTIVSRCQQVPMSPLSEEDVRRVLSRQQVESELLPLAVRFCAGSPGDAISLIDDPLFHEREQLFLHFLDLLAPDHPAGLALDFGDWAREDDPDPARSALAQRRDRCRRVLGLLKSLVRDLALLVAKGDPTRLTNADLTPRLQSTARTLTFDGLSEILGLLRDAETATASNVTPRLVLENVAVHIAQIGRGISRHLQHGSAAGHQR